MCLIRPDSVRIGNQDSARNMSDSYRVSDLPSLTGRLIALCYASYR